MTTHRVTAQLVAGLAREWSAIPGEQATLDQIVRHAVTVLPRCDAAGLSLRRPGGVVDSPAVSDSVVAHADALQYELNEGPCLDAIYQDDTYVIDDLVTETRWPRWAPLAAELGLRSVLSVRIQAPKGVLGGLNLYSTTAGPYGDDDVDAAHAIADQAGVVLWAKSEHQGLRTAMQTRHMIGMAQGILMARHGLTPERAFEVLRRFSSQENVKLREVAERLVRSAAEESQAAADLP